MRIPLCIVILLSAITVSTSTLYAQKPEKKKLIGAFGTTVALKLDLEGDKAQSFNVTPWVEFTLSKYWGAGLQFNYSHLRENNLSSDNLWSGVFGGYYIYISDKLSVENIVSANVGVNFKGSSAGLLVAFSPVLLYKLLPRVSMSLGLCDLSYKKEIGEGQSSFNCNMFNTTKVGFSVGF